MIRITLVDGLPPVVQTRLQGLYSRSPVSVVDRLSELGIKPTATSSDGLLSVYSQDSGESLREASKWLQKYVVGYGHRSLADTASVTLYFEGVTLEEAKLLQHHQLYAGIELSTRYVDMSSGGVAGLRGGQGLTELGQYESAIDYWRGVADDRGYYNDYPKRAVDAWIYDRARGYLPVTCTTNVSLHVRLSVLADILNVLDDHEPYISAMVRELLRMTGDDIGWCKSGYNINTSIGDEYTRLDFIPDVDYHNPYISGIIDYGSWRDLARHRTIHNLTYVIPQKSDEFCEFYRLRHIDNTLGNVAQLGNMVVVNGEVHPDQWDYIYKLRTGPAVHPTLRSALAGRCKLWDSAPYAERANQTIEGI